MEMRRKYQKSSEVAAPRQSQIKSILVILSINDTLIKKHLFKHSKFIAGKSQQCQIETDFTESCWTATKYGQRFAQQTINSFGKKRLYWIYKGSHAHECSVTHMYSILPVYTLIVCRRGFHNM